LEEELGKDTVCHRFNSTHTTSTLTKEGLDRFGDFKIGRKLIRTVKYADDLVLLAKQETAL